MLSRQVRRLFAILSAWFLVWGLPLVAHAQSSAPLDYRFGVVDAPQALPAALKLGVGFTRVPLFWSDLEPAPGQWNPFYTRHDQSFLTLAQHGVALVCVVETVPAWAAVNPGQAPDGVPKGLNLPWNNPGNLWGQFMYHLARHYAGLINTWIIGNEISIPKGPYHTWDGTVAQFAEMIRVAYEAAKAANPAAAIEAPGAPYWYTYGRTTNQLLTDLSRLPGAAQHHDFIDGLNLHLYNTLQFNPYIYGQYRAMLDAHGLGNLPIWLSEANAAPAVGGHAGVTLDQQVAFLVEDLAESFAYASRLEVYQMQDPTSLAGPEGPTGLLTASGTPRPAYVAYQTLIRELSGATLLHQRIKAYKGYSPSTPAILTFGAPGRIVQIVWDQGFAPTKVTLPAYAASVQVISAFGHEKTVAVHGGTISLALSPATSHNPQDVHDAPIGGMPLYVVQAVPMGTHGTPRAAQYGTPSGLPAVAHHRWTTAPQLSPGQVMVNSAGDQVAVGTAAGTSVWGTAGTAPGTLNAPIAAVLANGNVYVANAGNFVVSVFTPSGQFERQFGGYGGNPGQFLGMSGIAVGGNGTVYVTNSGTQTVEALTTSGKFLRAWGAWGSASGQFDGPSGIAVGPRGTVYVADTLNNRIQAFSPTGIFLNQVTTADPTQITVTGSGALRVSDGLTGQVSSVTFPRTLSTLPAPAGATAIADQATGGYAVATANGQVKTYSADGTETGLWVLPPAYGNRIAPDITALAWHGTTLYAVDGRYNRILAINTAVPPLPIRVTKAGLVDGGTVTVLPLRSHALLGPRAVAVASDGSLWIADTDHRRLLHVAPSGQILGSVPLHDGPYGVAVMPSGTIAVTGYYGGTVTLLDPKTGHKRSLGFTAGSGPTQLMHPTTVIPLSHGGLAIWDTGNQRGLITNGAGRPIAWLKSPSGATAMTVLPSGALAWTTANGLVPIALP